MNIKRLILGFLALICITGSISAQIQPGRAIEIRIGGVPAEEKGRVDGMYPVSQAGTINMPYIGQVRAAGMMADQLAASLQARYKSAEIYTNPTVQVFDSDKTSSLEQQTVTVGGYVRRTGTVPFTGRLTLWEAIQAAGGPTEFGSMKRVKLLRGKNMKQYDVTKPQFMQIPLAPNDVIDVPQKNPLGG